MKVWRVVTEVTLIVVARDGSEAIQVSADSMHDADSERDAAEVHAEEITRLEEIDPDMHDALPWGGGDDDATIATFFKPKRS